MTLVARHLEYPEKIFLYIPKSVNKNIVVLKVVSKDDEIFTNEKYELILPELDPNNKFIGVVEEIRAKIVVVRLEDKIPNKRKFSRIVVKKSILPVGIISDNLKKPIIGILEDISLGGFKLKLSQKDFQVLKENFKDGSVAIIAIFRFLETEEERLKAKAIPVRFNEENHTVGFVFTFSFDNRNVLNIYEQVLKIEKEKD
ncbi:MAG TPA: PilZ domain-containing protein [Aquifex aeolicus]|nr:PilZ domain-containing protein [Aquifex aeolicus]